MGARDCKLDCLITIHNLCGIVGKMRRFRGWNALTVPGFRNGKRFLFGLSG